MPKSNMSRMFTLARREMQESRNSLFWTPLVIAIGLILVMLASVILANRISVVGDTMLQVLLDEESASGINITLDMDDNGSGDEQINYKIEQEGAPTTEEDWDFDRDWEFKPRTGAELQGELQDKLDEEVENLNPILNIVHNLLLLVLFLVSVAYLLASLYNDRKDRSILFWRSMPVSEWEEVLSKLAVALIVAPLVFIGASVIIQLAYTMIAMLLVWRMDMDPFTLVLGNIDFVPLFFNQLAGWLLTALWIAPVYAWLLLASAAARRSPFMLAVAPIIVLVVIEELFLGTEYLATAVNNHIPHYSDEGVSLGFYWEGPQWASLNYLGMLLGLVFTAAALTATVYLRRYRFEI